jgi:hypothetical protein
MPKLEVPRIQHALPELEGCLASAEPLGPYVLCQHLGRHPFPGWHAGVEARELRQQERLPYQSRADFRLRGADHRPHRMRF